MLCQFLLFNKVNQLYVYKYPHIPSLLRLLPTLPIPPLYVIAKHRASLPLLCCCFPPANYFTFSSVYMTMLLSLRPSFTLPHHVLKSILYAYLFIPSLQLGSSVPFFFFLDSIYMRQHTVFVFLFLTCFTLYDRLQVHPPHYK